MKKTLTIRNLFIIAITILFFSIESIAQCQPYLGQTPPGNTPVRLVPDSLAANSEWQYHGTPTFSPDGSEMYYAIYRFNPGRIEIWYTECVDGKWTSAQRAPFSNNNYSDNNPYFSQHKDTLFFLSDRPNGIVFKVTRTNGIWSSPLRLNIAVPVGYFRGWQFSIANNGNIYAELTNSTNGEEDIYLWRFVNGQYQSPEKLTAICSPQLDFTPYIDPAERFIMFASRRPGGFGNTDIYISKKNSDGTWETPINLGAIINSGTVISPIISRDGKYFFFEAWMPDTAGGNPYWVDANVIYNLITDMKDEPINPTGYNLFQNYPNPFNPSTTIKYTLNTQSHVKLNITNILGETVLNAIDEMKDAGVYEYNFNASNLSTGIYFYQLVVGNYREIKKMVLLG
jgi:hypothetical protein